MKKKLAIILLLILMMLVVSGHRGCRPHRHWFSAAPTQVLPDKAAPVLQTSSHQG